MESLSAQPTASIPLAAAGWAETKACYRLLANDHVEPLKILDCHADKSVERAGAYPVVLCLQDTTELDFSSQPGIAGLGRLNYEARQGMYVHPTLMVTPEGQALGVIDAWTWSRKAKGEADIKESQRWIEGYGIVADRAQSQPNTRFVYVADREADIQELMEEARRRDHAADYLIRAKHNRKLVGGQKLGDSVASQEPLGHIEFILEASPQRKARQVRQTLYAQRVTLLKKKGKDPLEVTIIIAREENPPAGEKAIVWRLLSNRLVDTLAHASEMIDWYRRRWLIEIFFRILKSGCRVESLQLSSVDRLDRAIMIYLIIGWRILHVVSAGASCPNLPCDVIFDPEEWQAAWTVKYRQKPPQHTPKLGDMVRLIAGFGGFLGRKSDGFPGAKSLWEGMEKVRHYALGIEIGRAVYANSE
jgi:hypothetical protein